MKFKVRSIGDSRGIIIPKGFIDTYIDEKGEIEMHFDMGPKAQEMTRNAVAIEPPENAEEIIATAQTVEEVIAEDNNLTPSDRPDFYALCKKHKGYKGRCGCK